MPTVVRRRRIRGDPHALKLMSFVSCEKDDRPVVLFRAKPQRLASLRVRETRMETQLKRWDRQSMSPRAKRPDRD